MTPTREQVVQWVNQILGTHGVISYYSLSVDELMAVLSLARADLEAQLAAAQAEIIEQCRLNGIGAERELALASKLEAAEREIAALKNAVVEEREACARIFDEKGWIPADEYAAAIRARSEK